MSLKCGQVPEYTFNQKKKEIFFSQPSLELEDQKKKRDFFFWSSNSNGLTEGWDFEGKIRIEFMSRMGLELFQVFNCGD